MEVRFHHNLNFRYSISFQKNSQNFFNFIKSSFTLKVNSSETRRGRTAKSPSAMFNLYSKVKLAQRLQLNSDRRTIRKTQICFDVYLFARPWSTGKADPKAMFTLYRIVKRSVTESVPDRASVQTRNAVFEAASAAEQTAPLRC